MILLGKIWSGIWIIESLYVLFAVKSSDQGGLLLICIFLVFLPKIIEQYVEQRRSTIHSDLYTPNIQDENSEIITLNLMKHKDYLKTSHWDDIRRKKLFEANYTCERCGVKENLDVHHLHYLTKGEESMDDLQALCKECHYYADIDRETNNKSEIV